MKKSILWMRKSLLPMLLALAFSLAIVSVGTASSIPTITQMNPTTMVYFDPPTINGTVIGQEFTVNITIRNAQVIHHWGIGLTFNATLLNATGFFEGEFLSNVGSTVWYAGTIDNDAGIITPYACTLVGVYSASGDGRLAYVTFKVKEPGVSDLHLRDVKVFNVYLVEVDINIIDVFTVVVDTMPYTVVTVSDSTSASAAYSSGFYAHAFSMPNKEISFKVSSPKLTSFSNVTIPKTLLEVETSDEWKVFIDGIKYSRTVTYNGTHYSIYFTYIMGVHTVQITSKRELVVSLETPTILTPGASSLLNVTVYNFGVNDEINVTLQLLINGSIVNSTVISLLQVGYSYTFSYLWTTPTVEATYNVTAYAPPLVGEIVTVNNVATDFVEVSWFSITPGSGPTGTKVTVVGAGFSAGVQVFVTFNDMLVGYAITDDYGAFTFVFNVPVSAAGIQTVKAYETANLSNYAVTTFTVIDVTPLDVEIDVGSIHFRGESAEFYIQIAFKGTAVNPTSISALLYKPDGTTEALTVPSPIATGFYKITYAIAGDALNGTYALTIEASYITSTVEAYGTSFKTFLLSPTLTEESALMKDLEGEIEALRNEIAAINVTLTAELALIESLEGEIEVLQNGIAAINATLYSINVTITQLRTRIDTIKEVQEAFTPPLYGAVALALIAAVGTILSNIFIRRKSTAKPKPKT